MTLINIPAFSGLNILAAPQRIREDEATVAIGCDFRSLDLRAFRGDKPTTLGAELYQAVIPSQGASIFQWDDDYWVGTLGDKNFARSPTFYADATTGQRIFVADNAAPTGNEWDWVQEVVKGDLVGTGNTGSYLVASTSRRLGVPKPANITKPTHTPRSGTVDTLARSTKFDTKITVDSLSATGLSKFDKINLFVPAIGDGPYTVSDKSSAETPVFTLRDCRLVYVTAKVSAEADLLAKFSKTNHGLFGGEQLVFNRIATTSGGFLGKLPNTPAYRETLFRVNVIDADTFYLTYLNAGAETEFKLTATATGDTMRYAIVSVQGDQIDDAEITASKVTVALEEDYQYHQVVTYTPSDDITSGWEVASDTLTDRSYVVTFVNEYGDESEPSAPTDTFPVAQGDPVVFTSFPTTAAAYSGDFVNELTDPPTQLVTIDKYRTPTEIRLYRTDANGTYRLVTTGVDADRKIDWSEAATPFTDDYPDTELGEPLATAGWQIPPKDLNGILISPGGSLVGYKGRSVVGSVPYAPYAFPLGNRVAFDYEVVGLVGTSSGIVVVTKGMPALIVGDDPGAWGVQKLEYPYGCVARRSIVDMGELAIYASADGLIGVAGANVEILTRDTIKREQWQDLYNPSQIIAAHAEGRYYGITVVNGVKKAFMFDPRTRSFIDLTVDQNNWPVALYSRLDTDTLLILKSDGKVYEWNRGTENVPYIWRSKYFQLTRPDILGCAQVMSPALIGNHKFTMRLIAWDGETIYTLALFSNKTEGEGFATLPNAAGTAWEAERRYPFNVNINPFRLPVPNNRYTVYQVELEGTLPIAQVSLASTIDELKQV